MQNLYEIKDLLYPGLLHRVKKSTGLPISKQTLDMSVDESGDRLMLGGEQLFSRAEIEGSDWKKEFLPRVDAIGKRHYG